MALAEHLGLSSLTADEWAGIARVRGAPPETAHSPKLAPPPAGSGPDAYRAPSAAAGGIISDYATEDLDARLARLMRANSDLMVRG